jgi:hypothetical protein
MDVDVPFSDPGTRAAAARDLRLAKKILDELGIRFWLAGGTRLGAVREGDFITHDSDIDIGVWDDVPGHHRIYRGLEAGGFRLTREYGEEGRAGHQYAFRTPGGTNFDVFFYVREPNRCWSGLWVNGTCKKVVFPSITDFVDVEFCGDKFLIPANYEEILTAEYGDWRTPEKDYSWNSSMRNLEE